MSDKEVERESRLLGGVEIVTNPDDVALIEAENGVRQFDAIVEMFHGALESDRPFRLKPSTLLELNRIAIQRLYKEAGSFRTVPIEIHGSRHAPPEHKDVPRYIDDLCDYVADNWGESPIHLAAYVMWRLNWIHPFVDGNGRTARAVSYLVLNVRLNYLLPGTNTIPQQIVSQKGPYYKALEAADSAYESGGVDVDVLEDLLGEKLATQLLDVHRAATGNP